MNHKIDINEWEEYMDNVVEQNEHREVIHKFYGGAGKEDGKPSRKEREERLTARGRMWQSE